MTNRRLFVRWFATAASLLTLTACMTDLLDARQGKLAVEVKWPAKSGYHVTAIPDGTVSVELSIIGEGLDTPLVVPPLTPGNQQTTRDIVDVPIGPKALTAIAYDAEHHETARGATNIVVAANKVTPAELTLEPTPVDVEPSNTSPEPTGPDSSPAPTPTPPDLTIQTVVGNGLPGATDGYAQLGARLKKPQGLAYDPGKDVLYIADTAYGLIRKYDVKTTLLTTVAGTAPATEPSPEASAAPALLGAGFGKPAGLAVGPDGVLYFSDVSYHVIRRLNANGTITTVTGTGQPGPAKENVGAYETSYYYPVSIAFAPNGALYIADQFNQKIRRLSTTGNVTTVAGTGEAGNAGDGGPAVEAQLNYPTAITIDPKGEYMYIAEALGHRVRRVHLATGIITPVAGVGKEGFAGENGPALQAQMGFPSALAFSATGELLIAESWTVFLGPDTPTSYTTRILKVAADGNLVRIAGPKYGNYGFGGDGGDALKATFSLPLGLAVDKAGSIYVADAYDNRVRALKKGIQPAFATPEPASPAPSPSASAPAAAAGDAASN